MPRSNKHGYLNDSNDTNDSEMVVEALHENVPLIAPVEPEMVIEALHENVPFIAPVAVPAPSVPHQKRYLLRQNRVLSKRALESSKQKIVNQTKKPMRQAKVYLQARIIINLKQSKICFSCIFRPNFS